MRFWRKEHISAVHGFSGVKSEQMLSAELFYICTSVKREHSAEVEGILRLNSNWSDFIVRFKFELGRFHKHKPSNLKPPLAKAVKLQTWSLVNFTVDYKFFVQYHSPHQAVIFLKGRKEQFVSSNNQTDCIIFYIATLPFLFVFVHLLLSFKKFEL